MIYLWLKIVWYKIAKALGGSWSTWCRIHAGAGTDTTVPRARVGHDPAQPVRHESEARGIIQIMKPEIPEEIKIGIDPATPDGLVLYSRRAGKSTASTARMRELIEKGLVHAPDGLGDLQRVELFEAEREAREARAALTHDPRECPCAGRHYPSAEACRWCRCHRELLDRRPSNEIELCGACGHPQHAVNGGRCAFLAPGTGRVCDCLDLAGAARAIDEGEEA